MNTDGALGMWRGVVIPVVLVGLVMLVAAGCGARTPQVHPVAGRVTLDGAALDTGLIRFAPKPPGAPVGAAIAGGAYALKAPAGECRVEITSAKVVGRRKAYDTPDSPLVDVTEEAVPAKFNATSTLVFEVRPGSNSKNFDLSTK